MGSRKQVPDPPDYRVRFSGLQSLVPTEIKNLRICQLLTPVMSLSHWDRRRILWNLPTLQLDVVPTGEKYLAEEVLHRDTTTPMCVPASTETPEVPSGQAQLAIEYQTDNILYQADMGLYDGLVGITLSNEGNLFNKTLFFE
ncbi:hypothetical protein AVEN_117139-1 [Araneus ventricosus]|uniref:Uncharacterized protein n=1 Tax=Araneus ventricosus TaxID=182803 RepID=A0A4Y2AZ56_ARAVE|nr:hypothetical protein AVEN_117139-1 [Araneus ventricosus]